MSVPPLLMSGCEEGGGRTMVPYGKEYPRSGTAHKVQDPNLLLAIECPLVSDSGKTHLFKKKKKGEKLLEVPKGNILPGYGYRKVRMRSGRDGSSSKDTCCLT